MSLPEYPPGWAWAAGIRTLRWREKVGGTSCSWLDEATGRLTELDTLTADELSALWWLAMLFDLELWLSS